MRHPLRSLAGHGFWYSLANVGHKVGGIVLIPLYTNSAYLSVEAFGIWGVFEVSVSLSVAIVGLQLGAALIRFFPGAKDLDELVSTTWWTTTAVAFASVLLAGSAVAFFAAGSMQRLILFLIAYILAELLLAIPLALLRAQGKASTYMALALTKMVVGIGLAVLLLVRFERGLFGLVEAFGAGSGVALLLGLLATGPARYIRPVFNRALALDLLRFSTPLIMGGVGGMILNAGDRYVLALLRPAEDIALYTLAAKIGGVVNMFAVQPLQLAFLPIIFRLAAGQHAEVLRLLSRYLTVGFAALTVALTVFSNPLLHLLGSDPVYARSIPLVPWIGLGFGLFGFSILFDGVLTLHHKTGVTSAWVLGAAVANLLLNFLLVPYFGAMAAAVTTFVSYAILFGGRLWAAQRTHTVAYPWAPMAGTAVATIVACSVGLILVPEQGAPAIIGGSAVLVGWAAVVVGFGWITVQDFAAVFRLFRPGGDGASS